MSSDKLILCLPEAEFEIAEVCSQNAPIAIVVTQDGVLTHYRLHEGKLYTALPIIPERMQKAIDVNADCAPLKSDHPMFGGMVDEIKELVRQKHAVETRPERVYNILTTYFLTQVTTDRAISDAKSIIETERSKVSQEFWKAKAHSRVADIILIDGKEWVATSEPAYKLNVDSGIMDVHHSAVYDEGNQDSGPWKNFDWEEMRFRYYSANDVDIANRTLINLSGNHNLHAHGHIEVIIPESIRNDYAGLEIDRAARVCVRKIEKQMFKIGSRHPERLRDFPHEPIMAACRLRDALAERKPFDVVKDSLAAALESFIDVMEGYPELLSDMSFTDELSSVKDALEIWCDREIPLAMGRVDAQKSTM
jgi:hypothetical protein